MRADADDAVESYVPPPPASIVSEVSCGACKAQTGKVRAETYTGLIAQIEARGWAQEGQTWRCPSCAP